MPTALGLPNHRVVAWFPVLAALVVLVLVALQLSGTSSGAHWFTLGEGSDPRLVFGTPRAIRSDEWLVQQSWVVSQADHGYPVRNPTLPGGLDMTVLNELPSWDWSSAFRPHLWGYLFFGLDTGMAWHWWIPGLAVVIGSYLLVVTLLPRRPLTAALLAGAVFFAPMLQWWYTPSSAWPVAWALLAMAGVVWSLRDPRLWVRVVWAGVVGYTAITMAMTLYVPFMIPGIYAMLAFTVGYFARLRPWRTIGGKGLAIRLIPLAAAAIASSVVVLIWVATRVSTFDSLQSTVYPGDRSQPTGGLLAQDPFFAGSLGAVFNQVLKNGGPTLLGPNSSEGASVFLVTLFLTPALIWFLFRKYRESKTVDWLIVACLSCLLLFSAFLLLPGWDALAQLLQLDLITPTRFRIYFLVSLPLFVALVLEQVDASPKRRNWVIGAASAALAAGVTAAVAFQLRVHDPAVLQVARLWPIVAVLFVASILLLFVRRSGPIPAALLLAATLLTTVNVNPLYRGIFDLRETEVGQAVERINAEDPGAWVGVGAYSTMAILVETGVESYSGVQSAPPEEMWEEIDPQSRYDSIWNRLAHVYWTFGKGEPKLTNPSPDVISATFDACSDFAQEHVDYVLADARPRGAECLLRIDDIDQGSAEMSIYAVVPRAG